MEKIVIKAYDPKQIEGTLPEGRVYSREHHAALVSHLQPAIDYLLSIGNELEYPLASWESKSAPVSAMGGGWQQYPHGDFVCLMKKPLDLVALDYAQLVEVSRQKGDSREREVANVSRAFKTLANDLGFLGIILSQLNDEGKMRESRALAHDADAVLSIEKDEDLGPGVRALKARSASPGTFIPLKWEPQFTRFDDAE